MSATETRTPEQVMALHEQVRVSIRSAIDSAKAEARELREQADASDAFARRVEGWVRAGDWYALRGVIGDDEAAEFVSEQELSDRTAYLANYPVTE